MVEQAARDAELSETQRSPLSSLLMFLMPYSVHVLVSTLFGLLHSMPSAILLNEDGTLISKFNTNNTLYLSTLYIRAVQKVTPNEPNVWLF